MLYILKLTSIPEKITYSFFVIDFLLVFFIFLTFTAFLLTLYILREKLQTQWNSPDLPAQH